MWFLSSIEGEPHELAFRSTKLPNTLEQETRTGQKALLKQPEIWVIRVRLQLAHKVRDLTLFNLAIDSKLRACDLVRLQVTDVMQGGTVLRRTIVLQQKTGRPVQIEITEQTRLAVADWIAQAKLKPNGYLFPSRVRRSPHLSTRQYARIVDSWVASIGLDTVTYGTHTMRRTKATLIYRRTKNLRGAASARSHEVGSTVRYLVIEVNDALDLAEQTAV